MPSIGYANPDLPRHPPRRWLRRCTYWTAACPMALVASVNAAYLEKWFELGRPPIFPDGASGAFVPLAAIALLASVIALFTQPAFALALIAASLHDRRPRWAFAAFCSLLVWPFAYVMMQWDPLGAFDWILD